MSPRQRLLLGLAGLLIAVTLAIVSLARGGPPVSVGETAPQDPAPTIDLVPHDQLAGKDPPTATPARTPTPPPERGPIPSDAVRVQVVDQVGRGVAGIVVALTFAIPGGPNETRAASSRTDDAGFVDLVAEGDTLQRLRQLALAATFSVAAEVPLADSPRAELGRRPTADAPVVLRLPACGSVRARVLDHAGNAIADGGEVFLFWREPGSAGRFDRIGTPRAPSRGGEAYFSIVPLGVELLLRASGTHELQSGEVIVMGPVHEGQTVTTDLRLGLPWASVVGQLVDAQGTPFVRPQVSMGLGTVASDAPPGTLPDARATQMLWTALDTDARFRVRAPLEPPAGKRFVLVVEHTDTGREDKYTAAVSLPARLASGMEFDVGIVVLSQPAAKRILCAGRVVDANDQPLAGIDVSAGYWDRDAGRWVGLHRQRVRTDERGAFEIRTAAAVPATFTLSASGHTLVPVRVEASVGSQHVLVLRRGGKLHARIQPPDGVPAHLLIGAIVDAHGNAREPNQFGGFFGADNLAAGRYSVVVRIGGSGWEIGRVTDIDVPDGGRAGDDRLDPIDMRDRCAPLRLRLVDAAGAPLADTRARIADAAERSLSTRTDRDGRIFLAVPLPTPDLRVTLDDGRSAPVAWIAGEQTVTFPR